MIILKDHVSCDNDLNGDFQMLIFVTYILKLHNKYTQEILMFSNAISKKYI